MEGQQYDHEHGIQGRKLEFDESDVSPVPSMLASSRQTATWPSLLTVRGNASCFTVLSQNFGSSLIVAVMSSCLSIGLGVASGSSPIAGLRAAIWGGVAGGLIASSPFNVIGPAGMLTPMLGSCSQQWGPGILPWLSIMSGIISAVVALFGFQKYCGLLPKSVFEGFTVSVALTILFRGLQQAFPDLWPRASDLPSVALFVPEAILIYCLARFIPSVPWLVLVPMTTIILGSSFPALPTLKSQFGRMPSEVVVLPSFTEITQLDSVNMAAFLMASASLAWVSVLETLISARLLDLRSVENARGRFHEGRELAALSCAQLLSGLCGGLPVCGVFMRGAANQKAGCSHPVSQLMSAILVLLLTVGFMPALSALPLASVAAFLVVASIQMMPLRFLADLWRSSASQFLVCLATAFVCTAYDATSGILCGALLAYLVEAVSRPTEKAVLSPMEDIIEEKTENKDSVQP